jgi:ABC-type phosphate transport system auxiliary subunit
MKKDADGNGYAWIPVKIAELAIERITADATLVQATAALHEDMIRTLKSELAQLRFNNARLKAEVEQLGAFKTHTIIPNEELQAQVERLTKAGDLLAVHYTALSKCVTPNNAKSGSINDWTSVIDWNAAKEGKTK